MRRKKIKNVVLLIILTLIVTMLVAYGSAADGWVEIVIAQNADAYSMDPQKQSDTKTGNILNNMFDALLLRDKDMSIKPLLATEYKQISDTEWELKLREGIKFHNGEDFNAEAVKFTFDRIIDPETKSLQIAYFRNISCEVIDEYTVKFTTPALDPLFLARMTNLLILPPKYINEKGDGYFAQKPVGTGPFTFVEWVKDDRVVMEANPDYFLGKPEVDRVVWKAIPEVSTQIAGLLSQQIDLLPEISSDQISTLEANDKVKINTTPSARIQMVNFNTYTELGKNKDFRLAVAYAINREPIAKELLSGYAEPIDIPISSVIPNIPKDIKWIPYDVEKGKEALVRAGYPNGIDIEIDCQNGVAPFDRDIAQVIAQQLSEVGIRATIRPNESGNHTDLIKSKTISPVYMESGNNVWFDIDPQAVAFYGTDGALSTYSNPRYDELVKRGSAITNVSERTAIYNEAYLTLLDDVGGIPIIQYQLIGATSSKILWTPRPDGRIRVSEISINPSSPK